MNISSKQALAAVYATVTLDAAGIGLVMPMLPRLLRETDHGAGLGWRYGGFLAVYALMQFVCAPLLGALGDRYGRRPVLLAALAGAALNYLSMAFAGAFVWLFLGRLVAGICGASVSVASACIADMTPEAQRARRFGQLSACFGAGFILGPALGGVLGDWSLRAPFAAAAALATLNLAFTALVLPESHRERASAEAVTLNPFAALRWLGAFPALAPLLAAYVIFALVGEVGGTVWVPYGEDRFGWSGVSIGLSLAGFGACHALVQAWLVGPLTERCGSLRALWLAMGADAAAYVLIAWATHGWMAWLLLPLFCVGGIGAPTLQALLSAQVDGERQGRLQGTLAGMSALASVIGPLAISAVYFHSRASFPGLIWILGAMLYALCLPMLRAGMSSLPVAAAIPGDASSRQG